MTMMVDLSGPSPALDRQPSAKRARLDDGHVVDDPSPSGARPITFNGDDNQTTEDMALQQGSSDGRTSEQNCAPIFEAIAWGSSNCIAAATQLGLFIIPCFKGGQSSSRLQIPRRERIKSMAFSPRANAIAAILSPSSSVCVWTRRGLSLDSWVLAEHWTDCDGAAISLQWLAEKRRHLPVSTKDAEDKGVSRRLAARGPQFIDTNGDSLLLAFATDRGQITIAQGEARPGTNFRVCRTSICYNLNEALQQAAFGLVASEPAVLLSYTSRVLGGGEGSKVVDSLRDGATEVKMMELVIQIAPSPDLAPCVVCRPLASIFATSADDDTLASPNLLSNLTWVDAMPSTTDDDASSMNLVCAFGDAAPILQSWTIRRQEYAYTIEGLSRAEATKQQTHFDGAADWMINTSRRHVAEGSGMIDSIMRHPTYPALIYYSFDATDGRSKIVRALSGENLDLVGSSTIESGPGSSVVLSPHGEYMASYSKDRLVVARNAVTLYDALAALHCALLDEDDCQDIAFSNALTIMKDRSLWQQNRNLLETALNTKAVQKRYGQHLLQDFRRARTWRVICELQSILQCLDHALEVSSASSYAVAYRLDSIWQMAAYVDFTVRLSEQLACQAIVGSISDDARGNPDATADEASSRTSNALAPGELDLVEILVHDQAIKWLALITRRLIGFVNWLKRKVSETDTAIDGYRPPKWGMRRPGNAFISEYRRLLLCQTRVEEILARTTIDLSGFARACDKLTRSPLASSEVAAEATEAPDTSKEVKEPGVVEPTPSVDALLRSTRSSHAQCSKIVDILTEFGAVRNLLELLCPADQQIISPLAADLHSNNGGQFADAALPTLDLLLPDFTEMPAISGS